MPGSPCLSKKGESSLWFVPFKICYLGGYLACLLLPCRSGQPVNGPKDPWPRVLSLPEWFVGDPASLARDNMYSRGIVPIIEHHMPPLQEDLFDVMNFKLNSAKIKGFELSIKHDVIWHYHDKWKECPSKC